MSSSPARRAKFTLGCALIGALLASCAEAPNRYEATPVRAADFAAVRWVGRVDLSDADGPRFSWQGAGFVARFTGPALALTLRTTETDTVFFQPVIDGVGGDRFEVQSGSARVITLATGLSSGEHVVELYRETEGYLGLTTLLNVARGRLTAAPEASGRLLEVVGDSISAGYGDLGYELFDDDYVWCDGDPSNSSWYASYAAVAGRVLDAEVSTIAHSGWGMARDGNGSTRRVLPAVYDRLLGSAPQPRYDFAREPDAVIINLGTNDWGDGDPGARFEAAYETFLAHVRSAYPDAWLVLAIGSMLYEDDRLDVLARLERVRKARVALGDERVSKLDLGTQDDTETGCLTHPNVTEHQRMANLLQGELRTRLGW